MKLLAKKQPFRLSGKAVKLCGAGVFNFQNNPYVSLCNNTLFPILYPLNKCLAKGIKNSQVNQNCCQNLAGLTGIAKLSLEISFIITLNNLTPSPPHFGKVSKWNKISKESLNF